MNKKIIKIIFLASAAVLATVLAYGMDYPHNESNSVTCDDCHYVWGSEPSLMIEGLSYGLNIDDTHYNALCWSCHENTTAPLVETHSSLQTDNGYGDWSMECIDCHDAHGNYQFRTYGSSSYLAQGTVSSVNATTLTSSGAGWTDDQFQGLVLIPNVAWDYNNYGITGNTADTLTVTGTIDLTRVNPGDTFAIIYGKLIKNTISTLNSGAKEVRLFNFTGLNSFADGDGTFDGVCEVCHTQTTRHRNDISGDHAHSAGMDCLTCHLHTEGFKGSGCDVCHGFPPVVNTATGGPDGLVNSPGVTGSIKAGAHDKHVNTKLIPCENCHLNSAGSGPTHNDGSQDITIGFSLFGGTYIGGIYDGQSTAGYDSSEVNTTVINGGSMTCSNIYCHGEFPNGTVWGAGKNTSPTWDGSVTCSSCHDEGGSLSGLSGRHAKHTDTSGYGVDCEKCHFQTATGSTSIKNESAHANNVKEIVFSAGGSHNSSTQDCTNTYCHSDAAGGAPRVSVKWTDSTSMECDSCHNGRTGQETNEMSSNGHERLVSSQWVREYPCYYCHDATVDISGNIDDYSKHLNENIDVVMNSTWYITGNPDPAYDTDTQVCSNVYCHSDGTTVNPEVRPFAWTEGHAKCNSCHGHPNENCTECHDPGVSAWPVEAEWKSAMPMYTNTGAGTAKANTHTRHMQTDFTCDNCHDNTISAQSCDTAGCHTGTGTMDETNHINPDYHINKVKDVSFKDGGTYQINKKCSSTACHTGADPQWGDSVNNTIVCLECHGRSGSEVDDFAKFNGIRAEIDEIEWADTGHGRSAASGNYDSGNPPADFPGNPCWYCHDNDVLHNDATNPFRLRQHQQFNNRFGKECVYCHMEGLNSECLDCHQSTGSLAPQLAAIRSLFPGTPHLDTDNCRSCHDTDDGYFYSTGTTGCNSAQCHTASEEYEDVPGTGHQKLHNTGAGLWTPAEKTDVQNQYMMMGVCLVCHDDDSNNKCNQCHTGPQYQLGFDPGSGLVSATSKATSTHFGYKHYAAYQNNGVWKGGKFCWDCHDPHGDSNIYMVQDKVATETDGTFGIPLTRRDVTFTRKQNGQDYAKSSSPFDGICNVCHEEAGQHYRFDYGDGHNGGRVCTTCHEHRFSDSHASGQDCNECHENKPIPRHTAFGQPRDCTKCHLGVLNNRMDIMGQFNSDSHHIQGVTITNRHCYACHWEATEIGLIDVNYHAGYNYKVKPPLSTKDAAVDLVMWEPGSRPTTYAATASVVKHNGTKYTSILSHNSAALNEPGIGAEWSTYWSDDGAAGGSEADWALSSVYTPRTAVTFTASKVGTVDERTEVTKVTNHCLGCHSDQNNDTQPFKLVDADNGDCKTPNQYAWDRTSIAARYAQTGTTTWGKYPGTANAAKKDITKAFSAHGNAEANEGGFDGINGLDSTISSSREGTENVQCFDCHSSHGSKTQGVTSSYRTFNGTYNGANLKETQAGKGGYAMTYKAAENTAGVNPYNAGAAQCFDCHENQNAGTMPWGYQSTFGATEPIVGYSDAPRFSGASAKNLQFAYRANRTTLGGHLNASSALSGIDGTPATGDEAVGSINGLCTPCHDPHGVSPSLGDNQQYAVPLLKGTWMTSPYKEDAPNPRASGSGGANIPGWWTDRNTFGGSTITEDESQFAGLCLNCHPKSNLTDGLNQNTAFKSLDRVHESVKDWGNNAEHSYPCSKCHQPHSSGLPRLLQTNCLDSKHRGRQESGGVPGNNSIPKGDWWGFPKGSSRSLINCHRTTFGLSDEKWNNVSSW